MMTPFAHARLLVVAASAAIFGVPVQNVSAAGWIPLRLHGTITIQSMVPIGGDEHVVTVAVEATDAGWGNVFGHYTSVLNLVVDIDLATGLPLRGGGQVVQTNADGSTVTWENHFEGTHVASGIIGGTARFQHARGWVMGESVLNEDGTSSYQERGWITAIGVSQGFAPMAHSR